MSEVQTTRAQEIETRGKQPLQQEQTRPGPLFRPDVDIVERPEEVLMTADLPGVDEQHVQIHLENGVLTIEAQPAVEPEPRWTPLYREYREGGYQREFRVTEGIDVDRISASMHDGVLELHLPKSDRHRPRSIEVRAG